MDKKLVPVQFESIAKIEEIDDLTIQQQLKGFNINTPLINQWNNQISQFWSTYKIKDSSKKAILGIFKTILEKHAELLPNRLLGSGQDWIEVVIETTNPSSGSGSAQAVGAEFMTNLLKSSEENRKAFYTQWWAMNLYLGALPWDKHKHSLEKTKYLTCKQKMNAYSSFKQDKRFFTTDSASFFF
ncbi:hypothetical protein IPH67_03155 [bacterium]|nr:MAG: hypothetical protein IPH67_03155 [bacterium]